MPEGRVQIRWRILPDRYNHYLPSYAGVFSVAPIKIGIQLASLRLPFRKALAVAARLGATGVEIDARGELRPHELGQTGLREVRRLLEEHNLRVSAVGLRTRRGYDVAAEIDKRVAATKNALQFAADLRAPVVVNQVGRVPAESSGGEWRQLVESLTDLGRFGQHVGATLAAQTGTESGADLARLLDALPPHAIGVDLDPGNLIINAFSPLEAVEALGSRILHVHAATACATWLADADWKCRWARHGRLPGSLGIAGKLQLSRLFYDRARRRRRSAARDRAGRKLFEANRTLSRIARTGCFARVECGHAIPPYAPIVIRRHEMTAHCALDADLPCVDAAFGDESCGRRG